MRRRGYPCENETCKGIVEGLTAENPAAQCLMCGAMCTFPSKTTEEPQAEQSKVPKGSIRKLLKKIFGGGE